MINYNSLKYFEINFLLEPKYCLNISIIGTLKINMFSVYLKKSVLTCNIIFILSEIEWHL